MSIKKKYGQTSPIRSLEGEGSPSFSPSQAPQPHGPVTVLKPPLQHFLAVDRRMDL